MKPLSAFLLTRQWKDRANGIELEYWFATQSKPLLLRVTEQPAIFFVAETDHLRAQQILNKSTLKGWHWRELKLHTFNQELAYAYYFKSQRALYSARDQLRGQGILVLEGDIRPTDRFLMERFITAGALIERDQLKDRGDYLLAEDVKITASDFKPEDIHKQFKAVSVDIETDMQCRTIYCIGITDAHQRHCLLLSDDPNDQQIEHTTLFETEEELLQGFIDWMREYDPDLILGWNVVNFDLRVLQKKCDKFSIPFNLGRNRQPLHWRLIPNETEAYFLTVPGRVVLDGIDAIKSAGYYFESFSLDFVANELLGSGKAVDDVANRGDKITQWFKTDRKSLVHYNLQDCDLVWQIFEKADLFAFTMERSALTGLEMERLGGSVAAFENLYLPRLHRKGYVAPSIEEDRGELTAPGGYVMDSLPGLYEHILVLDFKSLYPSIIRTFKVDPYARIAAKQQNDNDTVPGFNGASFSKQENILPDLIETLWAARDEAKKKNNSAHSQAIKIIMNSFYGVLGTPGCRLHDARLTSSITLRGHEILQTSKELIEKQGHTVIYGDTDSIFVWVDQVISDRQADKLGQNLSKQINRYWQQTLSQDYGITSHLEMEYETHYIKFVMPTIRNSEKGSKKRYAGMVRDAQGNEKLIFKGLESVRTDWTLLARTLQQELYQMIFHQEDVKDYLRTVVQSVKAGFRDKQLVYRKRLRRRLADYQKNIPPHAQAANKADEQYQANGQEPRYSRGGWIDYVITVNGAEPLEFLQSPIDYEHYLEKQVKPIVDGILPFIGSSYDQLMDDQFELF